MSFINNVVSEKTLTKTHISSKLQRFVYK